MLQGNPILNLTSLLRISGDLLLRGVPDREGTPGSWMVMPVVILSGPEAALVFQVSWRVSRVQYAPLPQGRTLSCIAVQVQVDML